MAKRPWVIAHRGASGYLPEHTLQAKALAHAQGADFLEQDVVATRDGKLVVCHDIFLDRITNVRDVFPGRHRSDGRHYVIDFTWDELGQLDVTSPLAVEPKGIGANESTPSGDRYRLSTLGEEIEFVNELNRASGRVAGIFPEIKQPEWHAEHGIDLTRRLLELLRDHGYRYSTDPIFVQCFDARELQRIRLELGGELRLIQLVGRTTSPKLLDTKGLAEIATYAAALGPNYRQLLDRRRDGNFTSSELAHNARAAGLQLHPYTFNRNDLPKDIESLEELLETCYATVEPDAVFCDYPDVAVHLRDGRAGAGDAQAVAPQ